MSTCHEEFSELRQSKFFFTPGSHSKRIEQLTQTAGIGNQEIAPSAVLTEPVHSLHPALRRFCLGIRAVRHLSLDLDNQDLPGIRDHEEIRKIPSRQAAIAVGDEEAEAVVFHPALDAGVTVEEERRALFPFPSIGDHRV